MGAYGGIYRGILWVSQGDLYWVCRDCGKVYGGCGGGCPMGGLIWALWSTGHLWHCQSSGYLWVAGTLWGPMGAFMGATWAT